MRIFISLLAIGLFLTTFCLAQNADQDVVYLKNGGIMHGKVIELIPEKSVKLQTSDGNIQVFTMAEIESIKKETIPAEVVLPEPRNKIESWYLYFALGYGRSYYPDPLQGIVDDLGSLPGVSHVGISLEVPGVYWPLHDNHTLLGGSLNGIGDRYELSGNSIQINQYLFSFSSMHFLTGEIGDGFFLRGDVGIAWLNVQSSPGGSSSSNSGFGILLGGGYSIPVSNETRITVNLNYSSRRVESQSYGALSFNVGVLL
jgi:hypothetical protein